MKSKTLRPIFSPRSIESQYIKDLKRLNKALMRDIKERVPFLMSQLTLDFGLDDIGKMFMGSVSYLSDLSKYVTNMIESVVKYAKDGLSRAFESALGFDQKWAIDNVQLNKFIQLQIDNNISLVKNMHEDKIKDIKRIIANGISDGKSKTTIEKELLAKYSDTKRIGTIARTETSKINSQVQDIVMGELGTKKAKWNARMDSKTRKCHGARHLKEYDIKKGLYSGCDGKTIKTGREINCRCTAQYIITGDK